MKKRPEPTQHRSRRALFIALAVVIFALLAWSSSPVRTPLIRAQDEVIFPPQGTWTTIANGDDVLALAVQGDIVWAGTRGGGLVRWDPASGTFVQFLKPQDGLVSNTISDIFIDADGNKWLATNHGLSILDDNGTADKADDTWYKYTMESTGGQLPSNRVNTVALDADGFLWIGLSQRWDDHAQVVVDPGNPTHEPPIPPEYVEAPAYTGGGLVKIDPKGNLAPEDDEWLQHYMVSNTVHCDPVQRTVTLGLASDNVLDILPMPDGRIWVGSERQYVYSLTDNNNPCAYFVADPNEAGTWVQVFGGLSLLDQATSDTTTDDTWRTWNCESSTDFSCSVHQVEHDDQDDVWALMGGRGVVALQWNFPDLDYVKFDEDDGLPSDDVDAFVFGPPDEPQWRNTVWFSTYSRYGNRGRGVALLDHNGTVLDEADDSWNPGNRIADLPLTVENGLPDDRVQAMAVSGNRIWMGMGGVFGVKHGLIAFDLGTKAFQQHFLTANVGLPYNYIQDIELGQPDTQWANRLWVATGNNRERRYGIGALVSSDLGPDDGPLPELTWTQFTKEGTDDNGNIPWTGLGSNSVSSLAIDGENVWFGTQGVVADQRTSTWTDGGLSVYDGSRWTRRTDQNTGGQYAGMFDDKVSDVAIGCHDDIWIALSSFHDSSGIGINVLDPRGAPHSRDNDAWDHFMYPTLPSNVVTDMAADCERDQMWIATAPYFNGYYNIGGGVARYKYGAASGAAAWTRWTTGNSDLMSWTIDRNTGEVVSIGVAPDGKVWAGASGDETVRRTDLIANWPFIPAAINWFQDDAWSSQVFPRDGWVSSIAFDKYGVVWAATSRGGIDWAPPNGKPDDNQPDKAAGGLKLTVDGSEWVTWQPENSDVPTDDITALEVAPNGDVWVSTNGWGLLRFRPRNPSDPTLTPTDTPTVTGTPTSTPQASATPTATETPTPFATIGGASPTPRPRIQRVFVPMVARNWRSQTVVVPTSVPQTGTPTPTATSEVPATPSGTPTPTATFTDATPTTPTSTVSPTPETTVTPTPTATLTPTATMTPTATPTSTITPTPGQAPPGVWCAPDSTNPACAEAQINLFTTVNLYDIEFSGDGRGYIVGEDGFIATTNDGGDTWTSQQWGTDDLYDIAVVDDRVAWVAGNNSTLLRTTDGGGWFQRLSQFAPDMLGHEDEDFWSITALSDTQAWAVGHEYGSIVKWNPQLGRWDFDISTRFTGLPYTGVAVVSPTLGWAIAETGYVYRYNGTWSEAAARRASAPLTRIEFASPSLGWAIGKNGTILSYRDGQWVESSIPGAWGDGGLTGFHIRNASDAWATGILGIGENKDGAIYRYQGQSWNRVVQFTFVPLNGVWVNSTATNGWAVGDEGAVLRYVIPPAQ